MHNLNAPTDRPYHTVLDRIFERVLDFFDELTAIDFADDANHLDYHLANLRILQGRIACSLWLFGDATRAGFLGFPEDLRSQEEMLANCTGDTPAVFVGVYTLDDEVDDAKTTHMAFCLAQAENEIRHDLAQRFGGRATLTSVRLAEGPVPLAVEGSGADSQRTR